MLGHEVSLSGGTRGGSGNHGGHGWHGPGLNWEPDSRVTRLPEVDPFLAEIYRKVFLGGCRAVTFPRGGCRGFAPNPP
ncbi:hypothetical protein GCM10009863_12890 [Streptomyces axinellae]|uniref:Uncharacterized protein n=1 Tax=Streptomyces axinellae TaxID=552788 RepID=A0ABP6C549_9ACTN